MSANTSNARGGEFATSRRGGVDGYEMAFIQQRAIAGVPDSAIAKMLGRPVDEITECREASEIAKGIRATYSAPRLRALKPHPKPIVRSSAPKARPMPERARNIVHEVCDIYGLTFEEMLSDSHARRITHPRQQAFWRLNTVGFSLKDIGRFFGGRDHTTVRHGVIAHAKRLATEPQHIGEAE